MHNGFIAESGSPWIEIRRTDLLDDLLERPFLVFVQFCDLGFFGLPDCGGDCVFHFDLSQGGGSQRYRYVWRSDRKTR